MGLEEDYYHLLDEHGLSLDKRVPTPKNYEELTRSYKNASREFAKKRGFSWSENSSWSYQEAKKNIEKLIKENKSISESVDTRLKLEQNAIEEMLKEINVKIEEPVLVAQFPTGNVNAQVVKVPSGMLILVNNGVLTLIDRLAKFVWVAYMDERESKNPELLAEENG